MLHFRYDSASVAHRLPYVFIILWCVCIVAFLFVPVTTVVKFGRCLVAFNARDTVLWDFYAPYLFILSMVFPLTTMLVCYIRMIRALNESKKMFQSSEQLNDKSSSVHKLRLAQSNLFEACLIMVVIFLVAWLASKFALFLYIVGYYPTLDNDHYKLGNLAVVINSCVNPYVYALRYNDFKKQIKVLVLRKDSSGVQHSLSPSRSNAKI